jgi:hypothetical protein
MMCRVLLRTYVGTGPLQSALNNRTIKWIVFYNLTNTVLSSGTCNPALWYLQSRSMVPAIPSRSMVPAIPLYGTCNPALWYLQSRSMVPAIPLYGVHETVVELRLQLNPVRIHLHEVQVL